MKAIDNAVYSRKCFKRSLKEPMGAKARGQCPYSGDYRTRGERGGMVGMRMKIRGDRGGGGEGERDNKMLKATA